VAEGLAEVVAVPVAVAAPVAGCEVTTGLVVAEVTPAEVAALEVAGAVVVDDDAEHPRTNIETKTHMVTRITLYLLSADLFTLPTSLLKNYENNPDKFTGYFR
jgi:hypothetical protein